MKDAKQKTLQVEPSIGSVAFYGTCLNCGETVEITNFLPTETKLNYVKKLGFIFDGKKAVCKYVPPLEHCLLCANSAGY